jgi:hypothetical protein
MGGTIGVLAIASPRFQGTQLNVVSGTRDELAAIASATCAPTDPPRSATGIVTGITAGDLVSISLGAGVTNFVASSPTQNLNFSNLPQGPMDVLGARSTNGVVNRFFVRRLVDPASGQPSPTVDFTAGAAASSAPFTFNNTLGEQFGLAMRFMFPGRTPLTYFTSPDVSTSNMRTGFGLPESIRPVDGLHVFLASLSSGQTARSVQSVFDVLAAKTINFGAPIGTVLVTEAGGPMVRPRIQYTLQADYNRFYSMTFSQGVGANQKTHTYSWSSGFLQSAPNLDFTLPQLDQVSGFNSFWGLVRLALSTWTFAVNGWNLPGGQNTAPLTPGSEMKIANRFGNITF